MFPEGISYKKFVQFWTRYRSALVLDGKDLDVWVLLFGIEWYGLEESSCNYVGKCNGVHLSIHIIIDKWVGHLTSFVMVNRSMVLRKIHMLRLR